MSPRPPVGPSLPGPLVDSDWLAARLDLPGLVVLDASVGAHRGAPRRIPGARLFDIDGEMSDHTGPLPHTMPSASQFTERAQALGLGRTDTVVVYDAVGIYSSARAWWMLRAHGFDRAAVLDGGLPGWTAGGHPVQDGAVGAHTGARGDFTPAPRHGLVVGADEVTAALADPRRAVLDARSRGRYAGTAPEPRPGLRGGHMPGAFNLPFTELQRDGHMLPANELRDALRATIGERQHPVFSCGSGVTACVLALAADLAGYRDTAVYDGSWSEWGLPGARPVAVGNAGGTP